MDDSLMSTDNTKTKQHLIEKAKSFISTALDELSAIVEKTNWRDIHYSQRGKDLIQQISTRPDFRNIIPEAEFSGKFSALRVFTQFLNDNDAFLNMKKRVINETQIEWNLLHTHFISEDVLTEYLWLVNSLKFNDKIATMVATNFVDFIYNPVSEITFYSVLRGVNSSFDQIDFVDNVKIKRLSLDEASSLIVRNDSLRLKDKVPENRIVLEESFAFEYGRFPGDIFGRLSRKFDLIVESLRIMKPGRVDRENIYWRWDKPGQMGNRELGSSGRARPKPPITNSYSLETADLPPLEIIYKSLTSFWCKRRTAVH